MPSSASVAWSGIKSNVRVHRKLLTMPLGKQQYPLVLSCLRQENRGLSNFLTPIGRKKRKRSYGYDMNEGGAMHPDEMTKELRGSDFKKKNDVFEGVTRCLGMKIQHRQDTLQQIYREKGTLEMKSRLWSQVRQLRHHQTEVGTRKPQLSKITSKTMQVPEIFRR